VIPKPLLRSARRRSWRLPACAAALGLTFLCVTGYWRQRQTPRYQGKSIAQWFHESRAANRASFSPSGQFIYSTGPNGVTRVFLRSGPAPVPAGLLPGPVPSAFLFRSTGPVPAEHTIEPFRAMGTNAALWLAREVRRGDSTLARLYFKIFPRLPAWLQKHAPRVEPRDPIRCDAAQILAALGTNATPAIPLLLEVLLEGTNSRMVRPFVAQVLRSVPFEQERLDPVLRELQRKDLYGAVQLISDLSLRTALAARVLTNAMLSTNFSARPLVISAFYNFQEHADIVVPVLAPLLTSGDPALVETAGAVLQRFEHRAAAALPAVLEAIKSSDPGIRYEAVRVLEAMGTNALPAREVLQQATNDESLMVQRAALRTLEQMEGEIRKVEGSGPEQ
jgi:hypothetical protein